MMLTSRRILQFAFIMAITLNSLFAQTSLTPTSPRKIHSCAADEVQEELFRRDPASRLRQAEIDRAYMESIMRLGQANQVGNRTVYTIPVVVHVMHLPGTPVGKDENISADLVRAGIQHMTEAFRKQQTEYNGTGHNANIAGVDIEFNFELAKRDPDGNATDGILRVGTSYSNLERSGTTAEYAMKALSYWNSQKYMNIWLVKEICYFATNDCGVAGYAYFASAHGQTYDGIVNEAAYFGSSRHNSKVHVHEAGHYFNLYHTFQSGCPNSNCLTSGDQVCDTPPDNSTAAVTCNTAQNSCDTDDDDTDTRNPYRPVANGGIGNQDDNYENYMDYGYQDCQTTFTAGQKTRMVSALTVTRSSLITANNALTATTASALAAFGDDGGSTSETAGTTAIDCRKYVDVTVPIRLYNAASSNVTVNIGVSLSSTANNGGDFSLQTPSVLITTGNSTGNATVRIFNDKAIETTETVVLTISSATDGVAAYNTTYTISITDDDAEPSGSPYVLYSSNFDTQSGLLGNTSNAWVYSTFGGSTTNTFAIGGNGGTCTSGNSLYVTNNTTTLPNTYSDLTSSPLVYRSIIATGYSNIKIKFDYKVGGVASQDVGRLVLRNPGGSGSFLLVSGATNLNNVSCLTAELNLSSSFNSATFDFGFNFNTQSGNGNPAPPFTIDNFEVTSPATSIASTNAQTASEYLGANAKVNFFASNGELLATIENLSSHDYGCTTVTIDRSGTSSVTNSGQTYKYASKTIMVTPTTNNSSGEYRITLYYSGSERSGWLAATGNSASQIKALKTIGSVASATDAITTEATTTEGAFGTGYGYTATFNTGFSGFSIGTNASPLEVSLLDFSAKRAENVVALAWSTASETQNDYFVVEKSIDGKQFVFLTKEKSKGSGAQVRHYTSLDKTPSVGLNYYRLKAIDFAGKETFSKIQAVLFAEKTQAKIYPNPTKADFVSLSLEAEKEGNYGIEWYDIMGRLRHTEKQAAQKGLNVWESNISNLESGVYFVRINGVNQTLQTIRFIKL